jgi:hypothetical protein
MKHDDPFPGLPRPSPYAPKWTVKVMPPVIRGRLAAVDTVDKVLSTSVDKKPRVDKKPVDKSTKAVDTVDTVDKRKAYQREWLKAKRAKKVK